MIKKIIKIVIAIVNIILLIVIGLVIYIGVSIHDTTNNTDKQIIEDNKGIQELNNYYIYDAIKDTNTTDIIDYNLNENELNYLLYAISKKVDFKYLSVKSIYSKFNDDGTINVYIPAKVQFFNSLLKGNLNIKQNDEGFIFVFDNVGLGSLTSSNFLVRTFLLKDFNSKDLTKQLNKKKIYCNCKVDDSTLTVKMTNDEVCKTIDSLKNDYHSLYSALAGEILDNKLLSLKFNVDDEVAVDLNINKMKTTSSITDYDSLVRGKAIKLLENGTCDYSNISLVYDFLIRGYNALSDSKKKKIKALDLSSINIKDAALYDGVINRTNLTMAEVIKDNKPDLATLPEIALKGYYDIVIRQDRINEILNSVDVVGQSYAFTKDNDITYLTISKLETEIYDNALLLRMVINVNGNPIDIALKLNANKSDDLTIDTTIDSIYFGSLVGSDKTKKEVISYLYDATKDEDLGFLKFDEDGNGVTLDFSSYFSDNEFVKLIQVLNKKELRLSSEDGGAIVIRYYK